MKRRVIQTVVLLVFGAIANVAVAWGCVVSVSRSSHVSDGRDAEELVDSYIRFDPQSYSINIKSGGYSEGIGVRLRYPSLSQLNLEDDYCLQTVLFVTDGGWPTLSLRGVTGGGSHDVISNCLSMPSAFRTATNRQRVLPINPIWTGFAINTIFYAAILWVLFFLPGKVKRTLRRRRGLCPSCAYPIGSSHICTECGNTLNVRKCMGLPPIATPAQESTR
jgi:hypothetical protein